MDVEHSQTQVIIVHHINHDGNSNNRNYINKRCFYYFFLTGILVCALLVLSALAVMFVKYSKNTSNQNSSDTFNFAHLTHTLLASDVITDTAGSLRVISRKEWLANPPKAELESIALPVSHVIIAHTATENCTTQAKCSQVVRNVQAYHMELDLDDIGYNFLIGGDGAIYLGRGWDLVGAHTTDYNVKSICFAFIGTFNSIEPPKRQLIAAQRMIAEGVKLKKLSADYALFGHRQLIGIKSPGDALYEIIKKWNHWTSDV